MDLLYFRLERPSRSVSREKREPQAGPASGLSNSASKAANARGEAVSLAEPKTETTAHGEVVEGEPGSKSVARVEGVTRNEGDPHVVGRDPQVYQQLTSEVRRWYLESKYVESKAGKQGTLKM